MITPTVTICALPKQIWEETTAWGNQTFEVHSFAQDALGIEIRIGKGVNQEDERARLSLCCSRLEAETKRAALQETKSPSEFKAALGAKSLPIITLGQEYLDVIRLMYKKAAAKSGGMRLGATFFPPSTVGSHINAFASLAGEMGLSELAETKLRIVFFEFAAKYKCGIVEIQNPIAYQEKANRVPLALAGIRERPAQIESRDEGEATFDNEGRDAFEILREQVERAVQSAREGRSSAVNFSNQPHNIITDVLNQFAYSESGRIEKPVYVKVIYTDGSQAADLPLRCLPRRDDKDLAILIRAQPLRAALLSMRHLEMDEQVDISWFRNREVSKARAFAETDQFCYIETKRQLVGARKDGGLVVHLYQTGLQPAVIGFYRALIEELVYRSELPPSLVVVPFYHSKSGYRAGQPWF